MSLASDHCIPISTYCLLTFFYCWCVTAADAISRICAACHVLKACKRVHRRLSCPAQFGQANSQRSLTVLAVRKLLPSESTIFSQLLRHFYFKDSLRKVPSSCSHLLACRENTSWPRGIWHVCRCVRRSSRQDPGSPVVFHLCDLIVVAGTTRCTTSTGSSRRD